MRHHWPFAYAVLAESIGGRSQECMGVCVAGKEVLEHAPHYSHNKQLIKSFQFLLLSLPTKAGEESGNEANCISN